MSTPAITTTETSARPEIPAQPGGLGSRIAAGLATPGGAVFVLVGVLLVSIMISNPNFTDPGALIRFAGRTAPIAIAAMGQYYVIVSGEFDLSMGAVIATQVVLAGNFIGQDEARILPGILLMLAVGALIGVINGLVTTLLKVPSFIVTLGMMLALSGLVRYITGGAATGNPVDNFRQIGRGGIEDVPVVDIIPYPLIILVVLAVASVWLMRRPFGRTLVAIGDNPEASNYSGAPLWSYKTRAFVLSVAVGDGGRHPARRLRRRAPLGRRRLRVHRDHGRGPRRRPARWRSWLGALGSGRCLRPGAALHPADLARRPVHVARHGPGPDHHRRGRRLGARLAGRPAPAPYPLDCGRPHGSLGDITNQPARLGRNHRR